MLLQIRKIWLTSSDILIIFQIHCILVKFQLKFIGLVNIVFMVLFRINDSPMHCFYKQIKCKKALGAQISLKIKK